MTISKLKFAFPALWTLLTKSSTPLLAPLVEKVEESPHLTTTILTFLTAELPPVIVLRHSETKGSEEAGLALLSRL